MTASSLIRTKMTIKLKKTLLLFAIFTISSSCFAGIEQLRELTKSKKKCLSIIVKGNFWQKLNPVAADLHEKFDSGYKTNEDQYNRITLRCFKEQIELIQSYIGSMPHRYTPYGANKVMNFHIDSATSQLKLIIKRINTLDEKIAEFDHKKMLLAKQSFSHKAKLLTQSKTSHTKQSLSHKAKTWIWTQDPNGTWLKTH